MVDLDGFQMVSTGWANRTPWDTYREEDEPDLRERIEAAISQVTASPERTIFSLHCPPYGTGLDDAPRADRRHDAQGRRPRASPVGSTAVREAIEATSRRSRCTATSTRRAATRRLGRTLCINPGSSYEQGQLLGAVIELDGKKKVKKFVLTSG